MKGLTRAGISILCVALVMSVLGCSNAPEPTPSANATQNPVKQAAPGTGTRKSGGATPDMNEVPAPTGVKTGVLPGGAK